MKKEMKYLCVVIITMLLAVGVAGCNRGNSQDELDKTVQKYAPTGASIALIEHGEIKEIRNYGYADKEEKELVTDQTRFKIASVSKTVTLLPESPPAELPHRTFQKIQGWSL